MAVSAAGHAVAVWTVTGPCAADTYNTTGLCNYAVSSRRMAGGDWEAPILVGDSPLAASGAVINDVGDVLVGLPGWSRDASGTVTVLTAAACRPAASGRFTRQALPEISQSPGTLAVFGLDRLGEMTVVVSDASSGRNRIVAARGAVGTGFRSLETLDNGAGAVALDGMWAGVNGQLVVLWQQADGGVVRRWAAAAGASGQSLVSAERGLAPSIVGRGRFKAAVSDAGNFAAYDLENCQVMRLTGGNWQVNQPLPREFCTSAASQVTTVARNGNLIGALVDPAGTSGHTGQWLSYDAARNTMVQSLTTGASGSGYLFGVPSTVGGQLLLSESGLAAFVTINNFDTLPSASNAIGISGSVNNVWAILLKPI